MLVPQLTMFSCVITVSLCNLSPSGVPLSTQWGPQGYFYAIQIAQYGLSHYSKNLTERPPHVELYDAAEEKDNRAGSPSGPWTVPKGCSLTRLHDKGRATAVRQFSAPGRMAAAHVYLSYREVDGNRIIFLCVSIFVVDRMQWLKMRLECSVLTSISVELS